MWIYYGYPRLIIFFVYAKIVDYGKEMKRIIVAIQIFFGEGMCKLAVFCPFFISYAFSCNNVEPPFLIGVGWSVTCWSEQNDMFDMVNMTRMIIKHLPFFHWYTWPSLLMIHNICRIWINCLACSPLEKDLIMKALTNDAFMFVKDLVDNI